MTEIVAQSKFVAAWRNFISKAKEIFSGTPDDDPLNQLSIYRDHVLKLLSDREFEMVIDNAFDSLANAEKHHNVESGNHYPNFDYSMKSRHEIANGLDLEIRSFCLAYEADKMRQSEILGNKNFSNRWISRMSIVSGSVKDIFDDMPFYAKSALTLFGELCELFKQD